MNVLDENIIKSQRELLKSWRIRFRQIGYEVAQKGIQDDAIIPFLHKKRRVTFFTRDLGFYKRELCHKQYCLVCMAIEKQEVAYFVRRFLHHKEFDTGAKRMGCVVRFSPTGLLVWRLYTERNIFLEWA